MTSLGIDIGGTSIKLAWLDDAQTFHCAQSPQYVQPTTTRLIEAIGQTILPTWSAPAAVGLCVPGLLDRDQRTITASVNVPGLVGANLDQLVRQACGFAGMTVIVNDAVATAVDIFAARRLAGRLLVIALGTGVGAAVLDDGKPLYVEGESPGHLGQMDMSLDQNPPIGPDGGAGGLEAYIGSAALRNLYGNDMFAAIARWQVDEPPVRALVRALRISHALYRPDHICLAGGIGMRQGHLIEPIHRSVNLKLTNIARQPWTLIVADDEFHAARGAARLAQGESKAG